MLYQEIRPNPLDHQYHVIELRTPPPSEFLHEVEKIEATIDMVCAVSLTTINCTSS